MRGWESRYQWLEKRGQELAVAEWLVGHWGHAEAVGTEQTVTPETGFFMKAKPPPNVGQRIGQAFA